MATRTRSSLTLAVLIVCVLLASSAIATSISLGQSIVSSVSPSSPIVLEYQAKTSDPFAIVWTAISGTCNVVYSVTGPSYAASGFPTKLSPTTNPYVFNPNFGRSSVNVGSWTIKLSSTDSTCQINSTAVSESAVKLNYGQSSRGSLVMGLSANFDIPNDNKIFFAVSIGSVYGNCSVNPSMTCTGYSMSGLPAALVPGAIPYVVNPAFSAQSPPTNCALTYYATSGSCEYNVTLIPEPTQPITIGSQSTGQLIYGMSAFYSISGSNWRMTMTSNSGTCSINYTAKSQNSASSGFPITIKPGSGSVVVNPTSGGDWVVQFVATSGECQYLLNVTSP